MAKNKPVEFDLSIIVVCHGEGIILHKTLLSIRRSIEAASDISCELIVHFDNPTHSMLAYKQQLSANFPEAKIYKNSFGDPGASRNFCINKASGKYISLIDGDDLMSKNWLKSAFDLLESKTYGDYVAHSEMTVEFGKLSSIVQKYPKIDQATDALLSVWSGRWNSIIIAPSSLLKKLGYPSNRAGYGFEDWLLSCKILSQNVHNILVPKTAMFVHRKDSDSVWDSARANRLLLQSNELLSFKSIRALEIPNKFLPEREQSGLTKKQLALQKTKQIMNKYPRLIRVAKVSYIKLRDVLANNSRESQPLPTWLIDEWRDIHSIERLLWPNQLLNSAQSVHHTITPTHYRVGGAYKQAIDCVNKDSYDYILFVPWLTSGGADKFAIDYANTIATADSSKNVLVIATDYGVSSPRRKDLDIGVDFMPLGEINAKFSLEPEHQQRLLGQIIENSGAAFLHILNSCLAYDFVRLHPNYINGTEKKVIATSFSQSTDSSGRTFGFSHTHVPYVYELCSTITTDNEAVKKMWVEQYGFDPKKILVHRPKIDPEIFRPKKKLNETFRVLWAARIAPEKLPTLIPEIAKHLKHPIHIDMYGTVDKGFSRSFLDNLPENVSYKGAFSGFFNLPLDDYSAYLYSSLFDGLPNALVEASVARLPIIASAVGGVPEYIGNKNGILIDDPVDAKKYAAAIDLLYEDEKLRRSLSDSAFSELSNGYTPESHRKSIVDMLNLVGYLS